VESLKSTTTISGGVTATNIGLLSEKAQGLLCLDLGTKTGWALQSSHGVITSGTAEFKNDRWQGGGMRFLKFTHFLSELYQTNRLTMILFEEVRRHVGVDAAHAYGGFMAHLTAWCESRSVAYEGVPVGTIKKFITGKGNASKQKVIDAVSRLGYQPSDDNEADALALLHWAMAHRKQGGV
jgi:Holliday junction resolvasome RuvABC endonuclease subunit